MIEAVTPAYFPVTTQQEFVKTIVTKDADGNKEVKNHHYVTTVYDINGKLSSTTNSYTVSYDV